MLINEQNENKPGVFKIFRKVMFKNILLLESSKCSISIIGRTNL